MNVCETILEKGSILPLDQKTDIYKTSKILKKGVDEELDISIVEGESEIPDRNTYICKLGIHGKDLPHDLPEGTPVELNVKYTESREVFVDVYIPLIDLTLNARYTEKDEVINSESLSSELLSQKNRLNENLETLSEDVKKKINNIVTSVEHGIRNSKNDEDEIRKANKQLKDLKILLDKNEKQEEIPKLVNEYNLRVERLKDWIQNHVEEEDKIKKIEQIESIQYEWDAAIRNEDRAMLSRLIEQIMSLEYTILFSNMPWCVERFNEIIALGSNGKFLNEKEAQYFISKGNKSIESGDIEELNRCCDELIKLLPKQDDVVDFSGLTR